MFFGWVAIGCISNEVAKSTEDEDPYFWGGMKGDQKVFLKADPLRKLYKIDDIDKVEDIIDEMKIQSPDVRVSEIMLGPRSFILAEKIDKSKNFPKVRNAKFQIPIYIGKETGFEYLFDGIILLRPKKGVSIETILSRKSGIEFLSKLSSDTHFFYIENGEDLLTIANLLYEDGLVEWCHPNYRAAIEYRK